MMLFYRKFNIEIIKATKTKKVAFERKGKNKKGRDQK
jgi:hypothetical protein